MVVLVPTSMNASLATPLRYALPQPNWQVTAVMRQVTDRPAQAVGVWSIGDTAAHMSSSSHFLLDAGRGRGARERLDEIDAADAGGSTQQVDADPTVHPSQASTGSGA